MKLLLSEGSVNTKLYPTTDIVRHVSDSRKVAPPTDTSYAATYIGAAAAAVLRRKCRDQIQINESGAVI